MLAVAGPCRTHFGQREPSPLERRFGYPRRDWQPSHAHDVPPDLAFAWEGQEWTLSTEYGGLESYNYLLFCPVCGYIHDRNFTWTDPPLGLTNSEYEVLLNRLAVRLGITLYGENWLTPRGLWWVSSNATASTCVSCGHKFAADESRFWSVEAGGLTPHCEQCKGRLPP